jgi:hypothetical protein
MQVLLTEFHVQVTHAHVLLVDMFLQSETNSSPLKLEKERLEKKKCRIASTTFQAGNERLALSLSKNFQDNLN